MTVYCVPVATAVELVQQAIRATSATMRWFSINKVNIISETTHKGIYVLDDGNRVRVIGCAGAPDIWLDPTKSRLWLLDHYYYGTTV